MSILTCPACGYQFSTTASSNRTRCGNCRSVVKVPLDVRRTNGYVSGRRRARPPLVLVLLLACGHPEPFFDEGVHVTEAADYLWRCDHCGDKDQDVLRVLGSLSEEEGEQVLSDEESWEGWFASLDPRPVATERTS